jgi:uncharacterized protein (DUF2062 family)
MGLMRASRYMVHRLARMKASPHKLAMGFAAGAFASFTPFIGFHFILAGLIAWALRGNLIASAIGTVVGNPLTFPFIWLASYNLGGWMLGKSARGSIDLQAGGHAASLLQDGPIAVMSGLWASLEPYLYPMLLGGSLLGLVCAAACYVLIHASIVKCKSYASRGQAKALG